MHYFSWSDRILLIEIYWRTNNLYDESSLIHPSLSINFRFNDRNLYSDKYTYLTEVQLIYFFQYYMLKNLILKM